MNNNQIQLVRLFDVAILAPYLITLAGKEKLTSFDKKALAVIGVGTFFYNGINFINHLKNNNA